MMLCICYTFIAQFIEPYEYRGIEIDASFSTAVYNLSEAGICWLSRTQQIQSLPIGRDVNKCIMCGEKRSYDSSKLSDIYLRTGHFWFGFWFGFNNISVILWRSVLLVEETGIPKEKPLTTFIT